MHLPWIWNLYKCYIWKICRCWVKEDVGRSVCIESVSIYCQPSKNHSQWSRVRKHQKSRYYLIPWQDILRHDLLRISYKIREIISNVMKLHSIKISIIPEKKSSHLSVLHSSSDANRLCSAALFFALVFLNSRRLFSGEPKITLIDLCGKFWVGNTHIGLQT